MTKPATAKAAPCPNKSHPCGNDGRRSMAIYDYDKAGKPVNPKSFCQVCGTVYK